MTHPMRERLIKAAWKAQKGDGVPDYLFHQMVESSRANAEAAFELRLAVKTVDAILDELRDPDAAMITASLDRRQGPDDTLYGSIFTAMIDQAKRGCD